MNNLRGFALGFCALFALVCASDGEWALALLYALLSIGWTVLLWRHR